MNKITKIIAGILIITSLTIGAVSIYNVNHLYDRISELEEVNSQQHHRILELENK
jgi:preprotein translocase subunit SecG